MERCLHISDITHLTFLQAARYQHLYFGSEFCEEAIPTVSEMRLVLQQCRHHNISVTWVTPCCTNKGIKRLAVLFAHLPKGSEIVFNDWGVLRLIREFQGVPVLGRLLVGAVKDPYLGPDGAQTDSARIKDINIADRGFQKSLLKLGIRRFTLDRAALRSLRSCKVIKEIRAALFSSYSAVTTSRTCTAAINYRKQGKHHKKVCCFECRDICIPARRERLRLLLKGNTVFWKHAGPVKDIPVFIDRLIEEPLPAVGKTLLSEVDWNIAYHRPVPMIAWNKGGGDLYLAEFLKEHSFPRRGTALDIGCGTGRHSKVLMSAGLRVVGIDMAARALREASREEAGGRFLQALYYQLPFKNDSFDLAIDMGCFHTLPPHARVSALRQVQRALLPGGKFFLQALASPQGSSRPLRYIDNILPEWGFDQSQLLALLRPFFVVDSARWISGGHKEFGLWYVTAHKAG